jgi:FdhE protein
MKRLPELYECLPEDLSDAYDLKSMAKAWYTGDQLEKYECKENDMSLILHAALRPFLSVCGEALLKLVDEDLWRRGFCPICGGSPDLAFLDKESGARHLVCSRCDAEWRFQRMECPRCGNQDQNTLAYFTPDSARYRLYVCENCKNYLKAVDLRCGEDQFLIPLERFLTFDLDVQAREKAYPD